MHVPCRTGDDRGDPGLRPEKPSAAWLARFAVMEEMTMRRAKRSAAAGGIEEGHGNLGMFGKPRNFLLTPPFAPSQTAEFA